MSLVHKVLGAYSALFLFSTVILCKRSPSRTRNTMLALSVVMYAVSATHYAITVHSAFFYGGEYDYHSVWIGNAILYLPAINYILSDGIVLWRAWVLWNRRILLFIPPLISLVCTLGVMIASYAYSVVSALGQLNIIFSSWADSDLQSAKDSMSKFTAESHLSLHLEKTVWYLTVGTNLWATGLIFIKAWEHRRFLRSLAVLETSRSSANKALTFLVESGAIYLCIWIFYIATSLSKPSGGKFGMDFFHIAIAQVVVRAPHLVLYRLISSRVCTQRRLSSSSRCK